MYIFFDKRWKYLENYNEISEKVSNSIKKEFNSELAYNEKYLKTEKKNLCEKNQHKRWLSMYLYISNIDLFSLYKRYIILTSSVFRKT